MYYYIYKITNINSGKFYIGSHKTEDLNDGYFGSGIYLKRAIKRYGRNAFVKENIQYCQSEDEMIKRETEYLQMFRESNVYNLKFCSSGGNTRELYTNEQKREYIQKLIDNPACPIGKKGRSNHMFGKQSPVEVRLKQSDAHKKRFLKLKSNNTEWSKWKEKYISHALANQWLMSELNSKPVRITNIETGEILNFKTKAKCREYFGFTDFSVIERYALGMCKNRSKALEILKQYKIELLYTDKNK